MIPDTPTKTKPDGRYLSYGEKMVGIDFNPSNMPAVEECKAMFAKAIDQLWYCETDPELTASRSSLLNLAIAKCVEAQMMAVKALTFQY